MQTIHGHVDCFDPKLIDRIVCISSKCCHVNQGWAEKTVWIENTVDVEGFPTYKLNQNGMCSAFRFHPIKVAPGLLDRFAQIQHTVHIYGIVPETKNEFALNFAAYAKRYPNIRIEDWSRNIESKITQHSVMLYFFGGYCRDVCYGLTLMEAACLGVPIIAEQALQEKQQWLVDGKNGLVIQNGTHLVEVCNRLKQDPELLAQLAKGAAEHCTTLHNSMPSEYYREYQQLL